MVGLEVPLKYDHRLVHLTVHLCQGLFVAGHFGAHFVRAGNPGLLVLNRHDEHVIWYDSSARQRQIGVLTHRDDKMSLYLGIAQAKPARRVHARSFWLAIFFRSCTAPTSPPSRLFVGASCAWLVEEELLCILMLEQNAK